MVKTNTIIITAIILLIVGGGLIYSNAQGLLSTIETTDEAPQDGDYISVPTYGRLECSESDNTISAPPSGFEKFDTRTITCQQQGSLVQECDVTFKLPSKDEVDEAYSFLGVTKCTVGGDCDLEEGDDFSDTYYAKRSILENNYNDEIDYHLNDNEYLYAEYQEGQYNFQTDIVEKGRLQISYRPFFIYRYDDYSAFTGQRITGTEDCSFEGVSETNYIIENVAGDGDQEEKFESELEPLNQNNLRTPDGVRVYLRGYTPITPQYDLFDDDSKYCYDKKIYDVEEITVSNGDSYKVAEPGSNNVVREVECCNDGDAASEGSYYCDDFELKPLSESDQRDCGPLNPCPLQGIQQPTTGGRFYTQECVEGVCETDYVEAECSFDADCPDGYCDVDLENPENSKCVTRDTNDYCGNGVCEASFGENVDSCPEDCMVLGEEGLDPAIWIGIGMVVVAALLFIVRPDDKDKGAKGIGL